MKRQKEKHRGYFAQTGIYLGKFLRMFIYQSDWKVLPMAAVIAGVVTFVVGQNLFQTQEGTLMGSFALVCVCIWNGCFNSIQVVCRERAILKREHRAGLHAASYLSAHMLYQLLLCLAQTGVTLFVCNLAHVAFPREGIVTPWGMVDIGITILLITYASDLMALMISCLVRDTTTAMTVMPFLLIFQLVFSGGFFNLQGFARKLRVLTISSWGLNSICAVGRYNELPMVTLWNTIFKFRNIEYMGERPLLEIIKQMEQTGTRDEFLKWAGEYNQTADYASTVANITHNWFALLVLMIVFTVVALIAIHFVDRDKR